MLKITNIKFQDNGNWFESNLMACVDIIQKGKSWKNIREVRKYIKYLLTPNKNNKDYYIEVLNNKQSILYRYNAKKRTITLIEKF